MSSLLERFLNTNKTFGIYLSIFFLLLTEKVELLDGPPKDWSNFGKIASCSFLAWVRHQLSGRQLVGDN